MKKKSDIRLFVMDVDGTLTDGKIYMSEKGEIVKVFSVKDGLGIHDILPKKGIIPAVITGRSSEIVKNRCKEMGVNHIYQGVNDKKRELCRLMDKCGAEPWETAYMGDDRNDLECMEYIAKSGGITACPADASGEIRQIADYVSCRDGGSGAVRDFIEWLEKREDIQRI